MNFQNKRIAAILHSTLRNMTKSGARRLVVPVSAALLLAGCASYDKDSEIDAQELTADDLTEEAMFGGDDEASVSDAAGNVIEMQEEVAAYDDGSDFDAEALKGASRPVTAEEMLSGWEVQNGLPGSAFATKFDACGASATACGGAGSLLGKMSCVADLAAIASAQAELAGPLSAYCYAALFTTGVSCVAAGGLCSGEVFSTTSANPAPNPPHRNLGEAGDNLSTDTEKSANCPGNERVVKVSVWKRNGSGNYVTRVQLQCTGGTNISYGTNAASDLVAAATCDQSKGQLMSGLRIRHGQWIDAVGGRCQRLGFADINTKSEFANIDYVPFGGTGGTLETFECPKHQYLRGMKAHYLQLSSGKVLNYMRPHCR